MVVGSSVRRRFSKGRSGVWRSQQRSIRLPHLSALLILLVSTLLIPMEARAAQVIDCENTEYQPKNIAIVLRSADSGTVIRNCIFSDWNASIGAVIQIDNATDILLENNHFENIRRPEFLDIHAINISRYGQRVTIRNNVFVNVGADGVQMGDGAISSDGNIRDITITDNEFSITDANLGEEGVDIKRVHGDVVVADNRFHGYRPCEANQQTGCTGSTGAGMVVHAGATGVLIERNRFWDNIYGLNVGAGSANIPPREVLVRNNFFYDNQYRSLYIDKVHSIKLLNNTVLNSGYQHIYLNATPSSTDGWCWNRNNLFAGGTTPATVCSPQNNQHYSNPSNAGFVDLNGRNLHLVETSGAVNQGQTLTQDVPTDIDGQARPYDNDYDVGADEFVNTAQPGCLTATGTSWKSVPLAAPQSGRFVVEGDVTPPALGTSGAFAVASGQPAAQNWDGLAAIVLFDNTDNRIKVRNGGSYVDANPPLSYQAGMSYHVRMVVNVPTHTYDAYVTPAGGSQITLGTSLAFRTSQASVTSLDHIVVAAGDNGSTLTACNVQMPSECVTASGTAWKYQALPAAQQGRFVVEGDVTPPALGTSGALAVASGQPVAQNWDGLAAIVLFDNTDNRIKVRNGGSYVDANPPLSYQAGMSYHVRMVVNVPTHTYDAYVTPAGGSQITLGTNLAFRTSQANVASLDHIVVAAGDNGSTLTGCNLWFSPDAPPTSAVLVGAGDIAVCGSSGTPVAATQATAALLDNIPGTVFTTGDNAYSSGTATEFQQCYDPTWGRHKARTRPTPGNHEYVTSGASGYYGYFGSLAGDPTKGYYSYNLGQWHIIALNSNCSALGNGSTSAGCGVSSAQAQWLQQDLAANPTSCTLAYWHHPRWSSGEHGSNPSMSTIWQMLYDAGAEIVLTGHDHNYERFAPLNGSGTVDTARGIRQFVVGTGGTSLRSVGTLLSTSEEFDSSTHGVLKLTLHPTSYDWQFVPVAGGSFSEQGSGTCH